MTYVEPMIIAKDLRVDADPGLISTSIMQHWLRRYNLKLPFHPANEALRRAIIVGVDMEWYEHDPSYITEIGITILDPFNIRSWGSQSPWHYLQCMTAYHFRIIENAHMVNSELCNGWPDKFQFGKTSFIHMAEASKMLNDLFLQTDPKGRARPVILVGHDVQNDTEMIEKRFGMDIDALGVVVATIDTQQLAKVIEIGDPSRKISLRNLMKHFGLAEKYLHNADNDIVCTMIGAMLMQLPPSSSACEYEKLKSFFQCKSWTPYGVMTFCTKCDSTTHFEDFCREMVYCAYCRSQEHSTTKCLKPIKNATRVGWSGFEDWKGKHPFPCALCMMSPDPARHSADYAYGHLQVNCVHRLSA